MYREDIFDAEEEGHDINTIVKVSDMSAETKKEL